MLHLRMIVPVESTEEVTRLICATVGATHLTVMRGAAYDPLGDVLTCDVAREAADVLLAGLRELGVAEAGSIAVESIDLSLSTSAEKAEADAPGEGADAVVWESLVEETHEESTLTVTYLAFLTVATMLAAYGVMLDSSILIVGAMVVGPEFGPLAGICTGLVRRQRDLVGRSLTALLIGFPVAMLITGGFSALMSVFGLFTQGRFDAPHPATEFIWQPSWGFVRGGVPRRDRGNPLPHLVQVGRAGGGGDLGDDGARRRERRPGHQLHQLERGVGLLPAARHQPGRHRGGGHPDAARPEVALGEAAEGGLDLTHART